MAIGTTALEWASGFLEGEGSFFDGKVSCVTANQVQKWPLTKLSILFGGSVNLIPSASRKNDSRGNFYNRQDQFKWGLYGEKAIALMMTLYALMSPRRKQQIRTAIDAWKSRRPRSAYRISCPYGHKFSETGVYYNNQNGARQCRMCRILRERIGREKKKIELE